MTFERKLKAIGMLVLTGCLFAAALAMTACSSTVPSSGESPSASSVATRTVTDLAGRTVEIPNEVTKIAALCGPSYETIIMLDGVDKTVITGNGGGAAGWANVICPEYADIPIAESAFDPNIEELVSLGVEVVLFWDSYPDVIQACEDAGMAVVVTQLDKANLSDPEDFLEFKKQEIMLVGEVLGGDSLQEAEEWCEEADATFERISSVTSGLAELPTVYYVRGPESLSIHGGQSFTRYLVDLAGGDLVSKVDDELLYTTTIEQAILWDPEYIFMGRVNNVELITDDPAWAPVQAVKDGNVYVNLKGLGPADYSSDCFLLAEQIACILHPDLFSDLDIVDEVKSYYERFYEYELTDDQAQRILSFRDPA